VELILPEWNAPARLSRHIEQQIPAPSKYDLANHDRWHWYNQPRNVHNPQIDRLVAHNWNHGLERHHFKKLIGLPRSSRRMLSSLLSINRLPKYEPTNQGPGSQEAEWHHGFLSQAKPPKQSTGRRVDHVFEACHMSPWIFPAATENGVTHIHYV